MGAYVLRRLAYGVGVVLGVLFPGHLQTAEHQSHQSRMRSVCCRLLFKLFHLFLVVLRHQLPEREVLAQAFHDFVPVRL